MATPTEQVVVWCTNCERDFLMDAGLAPEPVPDETEPVRLAEHPCPVCPLKDAHHLAARRVQELQPWLLHSDLNESTMQRTMNEAAAQGWILRDVRVGHVLRGANPEQPDGDPLFLAVFHRDLRP